MQSILFKMALKYAVKYLQKHPDAIKGEVDDALVLIMSKYLGV